MKLNWNEDACEAIEAPLAITRINKREPIFSQICYVL